MRAEKELRDKVKLIREAYPNIDNEAIGGNPITGFIHGDYCCLLWVLGEIETEEITENAGIQDSKQIQNN